MYQQSVEKLIDFLREEFGSKFKAYYNGDPDVIPDFNLPCVSVVKNSDQMVNGPSGGFQRVTEQLVVKVIYDKAADWTADSDEVDLTEKKIRDVVEARDPATGHYLPQTLKYALYNRLTVTGLEMNQGMTFELGVLPRSDELVTQEGHLTITVTYLVQNPR
ncbi:hypothetical protein [Mycolicibacterium sp. S3B2]|uniref:hypothetical protein n=1 Tax=Mycolicibacterium sp. S3B2 TaxID=3415120 RepID=UPI003C7B6EB9